MANIGVIGYGFVGRAVAQGFAKNKKNKIFWFDKFREGPYTFDQVTTQSEFIFVCVPTPMYRDYSGNDMKIVLEVSKDLSKKLEGTNKILIIKSSVLPGITEGLQKKYPKVNFAMNPEFLTQRNALKDFMNPNRTVIGAQDKKVAMRIKKLYQTILPKNSRFYLVSTTSAEMIKFMSNLVLASKILLANEFYFLTKKLHGNYKEIKDAVEADERIGTFLGVPGWDGDFGFGGACFPKDMLGLLTFARKKKVDMSALEAIWKKNLKIRKNRDWEKMENAFGRSLKV